MLHNNALMISDKNKKCSQCKMNLFLTVPYLMLADGKNWHRFLLDENHNHYHNLLITNFQMILLIMILIIILLIIL